MSFEIGPQDGGGGGPVCTDASGNVYFTWNHDTTGNGSTSHQLPSIFHLINMVNLGGVGTLEKIGAFPYSMTWSQCPTAE